MSNNSLNNFDVLKTFEDTSQFEICTIHEKCNNSYCTHYDISALPQGVIASFLI